GEIDVHRALRRFVRREGGRQETAAMASLPRGAVARRRVVRPRDAERREAAHRAGPERGKFARPLLHALYARAAGRDGTLGRFRCRHRTLLPRPPRRGGCRARGRRLLALAARSGGAPAGPALTRGFLQGRLRTLAAGPDQLSAGDRNPCRRSDGLWPRGAQPHAPRRPVAVAVCGRNGPGPDLWHLRAGPDVR